LFKEEGAQVIITASSAQTSEKAKELGEHFDVLQTDVAKPEELDRLYSEIKTKHGGLDILFANAGIALFAPTDAIDEAFYDRMTDINVRGLFFTVSKALPLLRDGSSVTLTGSSVSIKGMPGAAVYAATKAAVRSFARTWTAEIPAKKARFNVLAPGPTETPIFQKAGFTKEQAEGFESQVLASVPAGRMAKQEEMAKAALFLASSDSSFVLGTEFFVDGGISQV
jgi:NAD(P)-dependent dehydrogenase (short-subunit alcohol dehydrogenase family)